MSRMCKKCVNEVECKDFNPELKEECIKFDYIHFEKTYNKKKIESEE